MSFFRENVFKVLTRSAKWSFVRRTHLKKNPLCAICGKAHDLEVHHIKPYSKNPELELEPSNLITLCGKGCNCHLVFGHLCNWKSYNPDILEDSKIFADKIKNRPQSSL